MILHRSITTLNEPHSIFSSLDSVCRIGGNIDSRLECVCIYIDTHTNNGSTTTAEQIETEAVVNL